MSNEQRTDVGQPAVDEQRNGNGHHVDDEGPLDPSVFFGLFDDLDGDVDDGDAVEDEPTEAVDEADETDNADADADAVILGDPPDPSTHVSDEPAALEPVEPTNGTVAEIRWSAGPDPDLEPERAETSRANGNGTAETTSEPTGETTIASPPPIRPRVEAPQPVEESPPNVVFTPDSPQRPASAPDLSWAQEAMRERPAPASAPAPDTGGRLAKVVLATIAVGLFVGLIVAFVISLTRPDTPLDGTAAQTEAPSDLEGVIAAGTPPTAELLNDHFTATLSTALTARADVTSLRFDAGTTRLDEMSAAIVASVGALLADQPSTPVTVTVRTYTEGTAADNLALSDRQADALAAELVAAGAVPNQIRARGLGATPLSPAQPVPNFVMLTPGFGDRRLDDTLRTQSPFTFGLAAIPTDDVWPLRPDGLLAMPPMTTSLAAYPDATLGAAGYSFFGPAESQVRGEAEAAVEQLTGFLVDAYGIDDGRISTITPGSALFIPTSKHGNHIWLETGPAAQGAFDVAAIDPASIAFVPGGSELDPEGTEAVRSLAAVLTAGGATVVVDVRAYDAVETGGTEAVAAANLTLSEARRDTLAQALITEGVAPEQLRMYASGASSHYPAGLGPDITITVAP